MDGWLTTNELATLAACGIDTVKRACRDGLIKGARRGVVGNSVAWQIPTQAGKEWAERRVPNVTRRTTTASTSRRTSPAPGSIPVTGDERPLSPE